MLIAAGLQIYYGLLNADPVGHDAHMHPMWLEMFARQVAEGELYPRWLTGPYAGFGSPTFYFYPPLTYYLGSLYFLLGIADTGKELFHAVHITAAVLSFTTAYLLLKDLRVARLAQLSGALLYAFSPYSFIDVFSRSALSEYLALAWLPVLFLGTSRMLQQLRYGWSISVAGWTLLLLTSMPATCCAFVAWVAFILMSSSNKWRLVRQCASAFALACGISAIYLLPAIGLSPLISVDRYRSLEEVNAIRAIFTESLLGFTLIFGVMLLLAVSCYQIFARSKAKRSLLPWSALLIVAVLFQIPYVTDWLYTSVQPFKMIRFPWRLTMIAVLGLVVVLSDGGLRNALFVLGIAAVSLIFYGAYGVNHVMTGERTTAHIARRDAPEYVTTFVPHDDRELIAFVQDRERTGLITSQDVALSINSAQISDVEISAQISAPKAGLITFHQFYWPYWIVRFNGHELPIKPDADGLLTAAIPQGEGVITARMTRTDVETFGSIISLASLVCFLLLHWRTIRQLKQQGTVTGQEAIP